ncbi:DUF448 domain-containing protein [Deinococcus reticulitermitis]|uniref:DUF448 domain-containing protein n=1 Tax=Deinococcus reticulitermitis TaxID=856736 RepID=UPI000B815D66|nr:YlxR family protein [Deinococcus reticulitermitis]
MTPGSPRSEPTPGQHVPERTCVACRRKRPQGELRRVTRTAQGWELQAGPRAGRGAYVCADSPACWQEKGLRRAFRAQAGQVAAQLQRSPAALRAPLDFHPD